MCGIGLCNMDREENYEPPVKIAAIENQVDVEENREQRRVE